MTLFTFTAYNGRTPVFKHQGFPSYTSTTTFKCLCNESEIEVPHSEVSAIGRMSWTCPMFCGRRYSFELEYPVLYGAANESVNDRLTRVDRRLILLEDSVILLQRSLHETVDRMERVALDPIRDMALRRPEDPIAALQRVMRQPDEMALLRSDISNAFEHVEERIYDIQQNMQESLESLREKADETMEQIDRKLRQHSRRVEATTATTGEAIEGMQADLGGIANLENLIQRFNPNDGIAQLQPTLFAIHNSLQQLQGVLQTGALGETCAAVNDIRNQLVGYNKRYNKSIGVIIG